jgi:hypothetical protein
MRAFLADNGEMVEQEPRFLTQSRILGSLVGLYYSLALAVLCFNFGLLPPLDATNMSTRSEQFLFASKQAAILAAFGTIAGCAGMIQLRFSSGAKWRNSGALTRLYFGVALLASVAMFLMEAAKDASWNELALAGAVAWIFLYALSLAVATANIGVGLFLGNRT